MFGEIRRLKRKPLCQIASNRKLLKKKKILFYLKYNFDSISENLSTFIY